MEKTNTATNQGNSTNYKVKLMCSYGGKIQPRPNTNQLMYFGGDTKILTVDPNIKFSEMVTRLNSLCNTGACEFRIKYQLPGEDLDALVSLVDDDDVEHMMFEYDRVLKNPTKAAARIRLFLFNPNNKQPDLSPASNPPLNPDFLFGFDKDYVPSDPSVLEKQNLTGGDTRILPALDLLQIQGVVVPGFSGPDQNNNNNNNNDGNKVNNQLGYMVQVLGSERDNSNNNGNGGSNHVASGPHVNMAANVCRIPVVGGGAQGGHYAVQGVVPGMVYWPEQPVYTNFVAAMSCVPEQKMMVSMDDQLRHEVKVNQKNV